MTKLIKARKFKFTPKAIVDDDGIAWPEEDWGTNMWKLLSQIYAAHDKELQSENVSLQKRLTDICSSLIMAEKLNEGWCKNLFNKEIIRKAAKHLETDRAVGADGLVGECVHHFLMS